MLTVSPKGRRYGALPAKRDIRDYGVSRMPALQRTLPPSVSLRSGGFCGPVRDQGDLGACTAFAGCAMREFLAKRWQGGINVPLLSPLFLYYLERQLDGDLQQGDTGSTGRTCVQALQQFGVCPEPDDPYDITVFETPPTVADIQDAANYKAGAYHFLSNVMDMKSCLASGYGFIVGFTVYQSFESDFAYWPNFLMPIPDKSKESVLGGHEVFFCGYDDSRGAFEVQNSWGTSWGDGGFFYFPYSCAADSDVLSDAIIQHMGKPW